MSLMNYLRRGKVRARVYLISFERGMKHAEVYSCAVRERDGKIWMKRGGARLLEVRREVDEIKISFRNLDLSDEFGEDIQLSTTLHPLISRTGKYALLVSNAPWSPETVISLARSARDFAGYGKYIDEF